MDTASKVTRGRSYTGPSVSIMFDGGLHKIGYVCFDTSGRLVYAFGRTSSDFYSNNCAELSAAVAAIESIITVPW